MDSIVKNVGREYKSLFSRNILAITTHAYGRCGSDAKIRASLVKLVKTWKGIFDDHLVTAIEAVLNNPIASTKSANTSDPAIGMMGRPPMVPQQPQHQVPTIYPGGGFSMPGYPQPPFYAGGMPTSAPMLHHAYSGVINYILTTAFVFDLVVHAA
jgi:hypothetical protein